MATRKPVTNRAGKVLLKHRETEATAWFGPGTVEHHRRAGWQLASENDQPAPAGDTGAPKGDSATQKENA